MKFTCDSCGSQYMISDDKVGPNGVKVRCKKCGNVVAVKRPSASAAELTPPAATAPEPPLDHELGQAFDSALSAPAAAAPAAPDLGQEWYVAIDDNQVGPLPATGVKTRWEAGEVGPDTLAWRPGMADWVPISTIAEMAQYLAPVPRGGKGAAAAPAAGAPEPAPAAPAGAGGAAAMNGAHAAQAGWKPSAASALAALASEEMASLQKPERRPVESTVKSGSLVDRMELPDGGVDPTNLLPLPIKGLETTAEGKLEKPRVGLPPSERTEIRQMKKTAVRSVVAVGIAMLVIFGAAVAAIAWYMKPREAPIARAPVVAAPAPVPAPSATPPAAAATPPATASATPPSAAPAPSGATAPGGAPPPATAQAMPPAATPPPAQPPATPPPSRETPPETAAAPRPSRRAPPEAAPRPTRKSPPPKLATAEHAAPPPAEPPRRKPAGDPLLEVGGDDEIEKELGGAKPAKRSVYVPPAIGSDLPDSVSQSQIQEAVAGQKTALLRCIEQQRAADANARGTLRLRWVISGDGGVRDVRVLSDEFAHQPVASCISGVVKGTRFPRSRTAGQEVVFPFKF